MNNIPLKHLKLNKFVYGPKQKIIKTTTQVVDIQSGSITNYQSNKNNIYYFSDIDQNLIDFHQVNFDYINNKKSKLSLQSYIDNYNPTFAVSANIVKYQTNDDQRIAYFPQYIYTPLDITQFKNSCYFLLPISTNKFVNIAQPNNVLENIDKLKTNPISKLDTNPISSFFSKAAYTPEDNSIPVYDMNFKEMQTIKFPSTEDLYVWIIKWGLHNIYYKDEESEYSCLLSKILFNSTLGLSCSELKKRGLDDKSRECDSILLEPFINYLTTRHYLYSRSTIKIMLTELFAVLDSNSINRYFKLAGKINVINSNLISSFVNQLREKDIYNAKSLMVKSQEVTFDPKVIPQNTLLIDSTLDSLIYDQDKPIREYFPSCYINFIHLKNTRDPQYQINYTIDNIKVNNIIYKNDYRFSVENNNIDTSSAYLSSLNQQAAVDITDYAIIADEQAAESAIVDNKNYSDLFPQRMSGKRQYYLNQYNNKYICNNVLSSMGTVDGLRNYLQVGTTFNKNVWLSYTYKQIKDNDIFKNIVNGNKEKINFLQSKTYELPFYSYNLNRDNHWLKDSNGNNKTSILMKEYGIICPWGQEIQSGIIGCTLTTSGICSGFCTFPCKGQIKKSNNDNRGLNWNVNQYYEKNIQIENLKTKLNGPLNNVTINQEWFIIPSSTTSSIIVANNDIKINDDLEIFIFKNDQTNILNTNSKFDDLLSNITLEQELKSIFQGFWNKGQYEEYRYVNNDYQIAKNSKFNGPHIITEGTIINNYYNLNTNEVINYIPSGYYCLLRVKSWWSTEIKCEGSIKVVQAQDINTNISNYDFIETIDGFFKFKQTGLHKSNIYSINLKNTGLSKKSDKQIRYYTKDQIINIIQKKYFIKYYLEDDGFLIGKEQNTFIHSLFDSTDNTVFKKSPYFKDLQQNNLSGFILDYTFISFDKLIAYQGILTTLNDKFNNVYYYKKQKDNVEEYNSVRQNIRQLIQKAIRQSITRYMPADTNLWKVDFKDQ